MHNNPLQSNFIVEVDEFKFSKIISGVLQKNCQPMKESRVCGGSAGAVGKSDEGDELVSGGEVCEEDDDSCSLSDYDDET